MKPVLVLQHLINDGPGYLATWLTGQGLVMDLRCTEAGDPFPSDLTQHRALAVLGGAMSANDDLPGLRAAEALIRKAVTQAVPVIGHCLGGQLMARALGAGIGASPRPEVGWHRVDWSPRAAGWFGNAVEGATPPEVFEWHFEAFALPPGAQWLAGNLACPNQAFAIGPHLAMQFHPELDAAKLQVWTEDLDVDYRSALAKDPDHVQTSAAMHHRSLQRLAAQQQMAAFAYARWMSAAAG